MDNPILDKLKGGSLISDGRADDVADEVLQHPDRFPMLMEGLSVSNDVVRGRAAHALEKVARIHPHWFMPHIDRIIQLEWVIRCPWRACTW